MAAELIKCENCGAEVDIQEPRCPYCGSFLYEGAEQEYWDKMGLEFERDSWKMRQSTRLLWRN